MNRFARFPAVMATLALAWIAIFPSTSTTAEKNQRFLDSLRERGMYDEALELLGKMRGDPDTPAEFRERVDYELGLTLLGRARHATGPVSVRGPDFQLAAKCFDRFLAEHPDHELAPRVQLQRANVLVELGRVHLAGRDAAAPGDTKATKAAATARRTGAAVLA